MKVIEIDGGHKLTGSIRVSGAKNATVALIPAAILTDEEVTICNVPEITDTNDLCAILNTLKVDIKRASESIIINPSKMENTEITEEFSKKLRASYYFMSALLGKYKHVEMYFPGGCSIGARPIDQTLKGFRALGADVQEVNNKFIIDAKELKGANVYLDMPSVGATINTLLVAVKAKGKTVIENAAKEPEIVNVATFLNNMGAKIKGAGTSRITIEGVERLHKCYIEVIPDRIEAGTYIIAGALIGENLKVNNLIPSHIENLLSKLKEMNVDIEIGDDYVNVSSKNINNMKPIKVKTLGYPGFPTDLQQPLVTLLTQANGISTLEETIYENRFQNVEYLNKMGSNIDIFDKKIFIKGPTKLHAETVKATDLRAGACLVLAGLMSNGVTTVTNVEHVLRGYENIIEKLTNVGAKIKLEEI